MSLNISGEKCAVCSAYLFPEDDIVYCPVCGAPHHRDCYNSIGHCSLEEYHGTDKQYKKPEQQVKEQKDDSQENTIFCSMCGEKYCKDESACPNCNAPNITRLGGNVVTIDLTGGVPDDTDIGDRVTVKEAKQFVAVNTQRYMPKFAAIKKGKKISWNWLAFLLPSGWLMSRKMYLLGGIIAALQIAFSLISFPLRMAYQLADVPATSNYIEYYSSLFQEVQSIGKVAIIAGVIGATLEVLLRVIIALFGDLIYKKHVVTKIKEINNNTTDKLADYRKKGGVNIFASLAIYMTVSYLPTIIAYTLGMI